MQHDGCSLLLTRLRPAELHHGDCVGADDEMHDLCLRHNVPVIVHPPDSPDLRAYCGMSLGQRPEKDYLSRDRDIVDETDELIAAPRTFEEEAGGTWYTVNYARKQGHRIWFVWRDGTITTEGPKDA